ncbi:sugar phosphate nucleotidyltransferase [Alkalihalobacillus sp. 1P02AB]|uniref:sugar phosphate nucleotidyltransferase n=1 Tax=Alkalihalobacillus sp. 1P02AB TaxID=3132260 RepID=UPI0039A51A60
MKGVIMAGGKGTRLRPLTCKRPKPMVPLLQKPVMQYSIEWLRDCGITDIAVTVQYLPDVIKDYFGDGSALGVNLTYFEETTPLGTAGSVKQAEQFLDEPFVVVSGDALTDLNLIDGIEFHEQNDSLVTIFMKQVEDPTEFGVIMTNEQNEIVRFLEKPSWSEVFSDTVNTGIYVMDPKIFTYIEADSMVDFSKEVFPKVLADQAGLYGFEATGYWSDIGNINQYRQAHFDLLDGKVRATLAGTEFGTDIWVEGHVVIEDGAEIVGPVSIGEGTRIRQGAKIGPYTIIGKDSIIDHRASLKRSILWERSYVGDSSELRGVTICEQVQIGPAVRAFEDSIVGSQTVIQEQATLQPEVKIWPNKKVQAGRVVSKSLIWNEGSVAQSLFKGHRVSGLANVEMTPDFVSKLGLAYGSLYLKGKNIHIATDGHPFSNLLKLTVAQSIQAIGHHVRDVGKTVIPVFRSGLENEQGDGGVFIKVQQKNQNKVELEFYGKKGFPITTNDQREMVQNLGMDSFKLTSFDSIGNYAREIAVDQHYVKRLISSLDVKSIQNRSWKVVVSGDGEANSLEILWRALNCHVVKAAPQLSITEFSDYVVEQKADIGLIFDESLQTLSVLNSDGAILSDEDHLSLYVYLELEKGEKEQVAIPVYAGSALEEIAASYESATLVRTKGSTLAMMETENTVQLCFYDAIYAAANLLNVLTVQNTSLDTVLSSFPKESIYFEEVTCHTEQKGMVMRKLMEQFQGNHLDLIDGVKVSHQEGGWTFIVPAQDEPIFTIYSQATEPVTAKQNTQIYVEKIKQIKQ